MSGPLCLLVETEREWRLHVGDQLDVFPAAEQPGPIVDRLRERLREVNASTAVGVIAPASHSCFFASLGRLPKEELRDRSSLLFRLEDHLPIDAESMAADFMTFGDGGEGREVTGIAIDAERWRGWIEPLESCGVDVKAIVPADLLRIKTVVEAAGTSDSQPILIRGEHVWQWLEACPAGVRRWKRLPPRDDALQQHRQIYGVDGPDVILEDDDDEPLLTSANRLLRGKWADWPNLRRDRLAPADRFREIEGPLKLAVASALILLLTLTAAGWWKAGVIESRIDQLLQTQQTRFGEAFPEARATGAILRRVRSEHAKALGSRGESSDIELPISALRVAERLLAALPQGMKFRVGRIEIRDGDLQIEVQVKSLADAGKLATALAREGFDVDPPATNQKDARTYESTLIGRLPRDLGPFRASNPRPEETSDLRLPQERRTVGTSNPVDPEPGDA